jgi:hypothetical protein
VAQLLGCYVANTPDQAGFDPRGGSLGVNTLHRLAFGCLDTFFNRRSRVSWFSWMNAPPT